MTAYEIANKWQLQYGEESLQERIDWELAANATGESLFEHIKRILPNKKEWVLWLRRGSDKLHAYKWDEFARKAGV